MAYEVGATDKKLDTWHTMDDHDREKFTKQTLLELEQGCHPHQAAALTADEAVVCLALAGRALPGGAVGCSFSASRIVMTLS